MVFEPQLLELPFGIAQHRGHQIRFRAAQDGISCLDHHHLAAQGGIDRAHLHADVPAAYDQKILGNVLQLQGAVRRHDARIAQVERLGHGRLGAHRHNGLLEGDELLAFGGLHAQGLRILEMAAAMHHLDVAALGQAGNALAQFLEDGILPGAQLVQIDMRRAKSDALTGGIVRFADQIGGMQQGFGGNAAPVKADAAQTGLLLDQNDLLALVGGIKRGGIAARPATHHDDFSINRFHELPELFYSHHCFLKLLDGLDQILDKPRGGSAVDHPMVIRQAQRQPACAARSCRREPRV